MEFPSTDRKIRELRQQFDNLSNSKTIDEFEANFAAFLSVGRTVTLALQSDAGISFNKDGSVKDKGHKEGLSCWYVEKRNEMRQDELCKFFKDTRDVDVHTGNSIITAGYTLTGPIGIKAPEEGVLVITDRGTYEVFNKGTPHETKNQLLLGAAETFEFSLNNAPRFHRGLELNDRTPLGLCLKFKEYLENLVLEAKSNFL